MVPFCYLCFVSVILYCLLIAALWSPAGKGLTSWLSCIHLLWHLWINVYDKKLQFTPIKYMFCSMFCMWCFLVFLSLSHVVSWVRCGTCLYRFLIFALFLTFIWKIKLKRFKSQSKFHFFFLPENTVFRIAGIYYTSRFTVLNDCAEQIQVFFTKTFIHACSWQQIRERTS